MKIETIGKVKLDLTNYPGEDKYCDGDVEDTLLEIARDRSSVEYQSIIEESASWPVLYHLSPLRENIVEWLPIEPSMKVLEIGAGCGAITGALSRKAGRVDCVDLSLKRSRINAYRHMNDDNITIYVGNFTDVEKTLDRDYDWILLIGVFEYAQSYVNSNDPYGDFLTLIKQHLKSGGSIAIAIENRLGLKYWAGCAEDHLGQYFASLEDYPDGGVVRTFTDSGLIDIARRCGFSDYRMYYPYPDYKFATNIYSDRRLPLRGELKDNLRNLDRARMLLFNEKNVFDSLLGEGLFHLFSNSYMLILGSVPDTDYVRYSNDRMRDYSICTQIKTVNGIKAVIKRALSEEARAHLAKYADSCKRLRARYAGSRLEINKATLSDDGMSLILDYVEGITLEQEMDRMLAEGDEAGIESLFKEYLERISYGEESASITDLDLIFSNIIISGNKWTVIDYEWTTTENMKAAELGFRAVYCYLLEDEKRDKLNLDSIMEILNINEDTAQSLRDQEMRFQKKVTGNHRSLGEIRELIGNPVIRPEESDTVSADPLASRPQVYMDTGRGFNEDESFFTENAVFSAHTGPGIKALRIDPCSDFCLVTVRSIRWNGFVIHPGRKGYKCNGRMIGRDTYAFATSDPGFTVSVKGLPDAGDNVLEVDMTVMPLDAETAGRLG